MSETSDTYANADAVVSAAWLAAHLDDPQVRIVESSADPLLYRAGHIPGALQLDWLADLQDPLTRDVAGPAQVARALAARGIGPESTIVLYGDMHNWWAAYAFWVLRLFGHRDLRLLNGGRARWAAEERPLSSEVPQPVPADYPPLPGNPAPRARRADIEAALRQSGAVALADVRTHNEYRGEAPAPAEASSALAQTQRHGHIPGARHVPWSELIRDDGTLPPRAALARSFAERGITPEREVITYCLVGVLSSYAWFVLHELLGYPHVRNYDGSWSEWGNLVGVPIARQAPPEA
jgi:thiosulfate/3-mercaptopyruvate sulfurtransferase